MSEPGAYAVTKQVVAEGPEGPVCFPCPKSPQWTGMGPEFEDAPECIVDEKDPRFCRCPQCGATYRTPVHTVLGILLARTAK